MSITTPIQPAIHWLSPLTQLKGVGSQLAQKLAKLQLYRVGDLLLHCPYRYEDHTRLTPMQDLVPERHVLIQGEILACQEIKKRKKRLLLTIADNTGSLQLLFFHYYPSQQQQWQKGTLLRCFGQVKRVKDGLQMVHPECEIIEQDQIHLLPEHYTPIYPIVEGLAQKWLRKTIHKVVKTYLAECGPQDDFAHLLQATYPLLPWQEALRVIHFPSVEIDLNALNNRQHPAFMRLILEEIFAHHLSLKRLKEQEKLRQAKPIKLAPAIFDQFLRALPFTLTAAQQRVWQEIAQDLAQEVPTLRLIQGDVGCGKTLIAILAALAAVKSDCQVAVMAPTEILAEQHYQSFQQWLSPLNVRCELLISKLKSKAKRSVLENITLGLAQVVIGTQALFQDNIQFQALGLVIIDEQHRFGVQQRLALQLKGNSALTPLIPHQLIMTATPIPRTLAMSHYAHLDISTIDALPPGRQSIVTLAIAQSKRSEVISKIATVCAKGQQVYWVCTLIAESEVLQCQAAETAAQQLQQWLPDFQIGLVHGRLDPALKEEIMTAFYQGKIDVLVATTVIEVGVNVPNASLMIIENPERLGLAQLHQLRGRVGRGALQSFCILLYSSPLSAMAQARLNILRQTNDGFVISEADLKLRGPGEVLGVRQTGAVSFKIADFQRDQHFFQIMSEWIPLLKPLLTAYQEKIIQRWSINVDCAQV